MKSFVIKAAFAALAVALLQHFVGWGEIFAYMKSFVRENSDWRVFLPVMGVGCAVGMPLSFCYVFAGAAYPFWLAWPLCFCGLFVSSSIGYVFGKFFAPKGFSKRLAEKYGFSLSQRNVMNVNFFVRAVPCLPYTAQNVLLGAFGTDFKTYAFVNILVQGAISAAMLVLSGAVFSDGEFGWGKFLVVAVLIAAICAEHYFLRKIYSASSENGVGKNGQDN